MERQREIRELECQVRKEALVISRWLTNKHGLSHTETAKQIGIATSTLRKWSKQRKNDKKLKPRARGRKPRKIRQSKINEVMALLFILGPSAHISKLERYFPDIPREHLQELKRDYGVTIASKFRWVVNTLRWTTAGTVWAMDYTKPLKPIEDYYKKILAVRDLSSGCTLLTLPVPEETSKVTIQALKALFLEHGAPLVIKCDNGSPFAAVETQRFLNDYGVLQLFSPPRTPQYNAAVEAGMGSIKVHTHYASARNNRPGQWTCDDLEIARCTMNFFGRPIGKNEKSPKEVFEAKLPINESHRLAIWKEYRIQIKEGLKEKNVRELQELNKTERGAVKRQAIADALVKLDYLQFRKRRVSPPFKRQKAA